MNRKRSSLFDCLDRRPCLLQFLRIAQGDRFVGLPLNAGRGPDKPNGLIRLPEWFETGG
jgi:hypothetical protein